VNGRAVFNMTHAECVREIKSSGQYLRLECERYVISLTVLPHTEIYSAAAPDLHLFPDPDPLFVILI
jgi:hypothetical protein